MLCTTGGLLYDDSPRDSRCKKTIIISLLKDDEVLVMHFGSTIGIPRPPRSKAIWHKGTIYFVLTYADLFGMSIKESELGFRTKGKRGIYLLKATEEETALVASALARAERVFVSRLEEVLGSNG